MHSGGRPRWIAWVHDPDEAWATTKHRDVASGSMGKEIMTIRTPEEFQVQVKLKGIKVWEIRRCSFCNYPLAFVFAEDGRVGYDSGCDCSYGPSYIQERNWGDVARHYNNNQPEVNPNMNSDSTWVVETNAFWGFD